MKVKYVLATLAVVSLITIAVVLTVDNHDKSENQVSLSPQSVAWEQSSSDKEEKSLSLYFNSTNGRLEVHKISLKTANKLSTFASGTRHIIFDQFGQAILYVDTEVFSDLVFGTLIDKEGAKTKFHIRTTFVQLSTGIKGVISPLSDTLNPNKTTQNSIFYMEFGSYRNIVDLGQKSTSFFLNETNHPNMVRFFNWAMSTYITGVHSARDTATSFSVQSKEFGTGDMSLQGWWKWCYLDCGFHVIELIKNCAEAYGEDGVNILEDAECFNDAYESGKSCVCCVTDDKYSWCG